MGVCQNGHIFFFEEMVNPFREKGQPFLKKQSTIFKNQSTVLIRTVDPFRGQSKF